MDGVGVGVGFAIACGGVDGGIVGVVIVGSGGIDVSGVNGGAGVVVVGRGSSVAVVFAFDVSGSGINLHRTPWVYLHPHLFSLFGNNFLIFHPLPQHSMTLSMKYERIAMQSFALFEGKINKQENLQFRLHRGCNFIHTLREEKNLNLTFDTLWVSLLPYS